MCYIVSEKEKMDKRKLIPSSEQYKETLTKLSEDDSDIAKKCLVAVRMGCEMGLSRLELVNARVSDIDREHKRGLWIQRAKKVRRGKQFKMRTREVPINQNLYAFLKAYITNGQIYILKREKRDLNKPFYPRHINHLYEKCNVPWSTHKSRHYFKNCIADWMREKRQVDIGLIKEYMGHQKTTNETYGSIKWDYKLGVIDSVKW
jgi:integrase